MYIFVAVFVPANHIDAIHRFFFLPFLIIINLDDVRALEKNERIKIRRRTDEMHVESQDLLLPGS